MRAAPRQCPRSLGSAAVAVTAATAAAATEQLRFRVRSVSGLLAVIPSQSIVVVVVAVVVVVVASCRRQDVFRLLLSGREFDVFRSALTRFTNLFR